MSVDLLIAAAGLIFSGIVKGTVGFGLPMIEAPVLAGFVGPRTAVVVMSIVNVFTAVAVAGRGGVPLRAYAGLLLPMALVTGLGTVVGAQLLASLDPRVLSALVGLVAMLFGLLSATRVQVSLPTRGGRPIGWLVGLSAGVLGGTTSVSAALIALYLHALQLPKRDFVVLLNVLLAILSVVQVVAYARLGLFSASILEASALTIACVAIGIGLGFVMQDRIDQQRFSRVVVVVIFLVGLALVARAVVG